MRETLLYKITGITFLFMLLLTLNIFAVEYNLRVKSSLTPSTTIVDGSFVLSWVREDGFIKIGVGEINRSSKKLEVGYYETLNDMTNYSTALTSYGDDVVLFYIDEDRNIRYKIYELKNDKLNEVSSKVLPFQISPSNLPGTKPVDIYMKENYLFATWLEEGDLSSSETSNQMVLFCFSVRDGKLNTETKRNLEGYTFITSPNISILGSYLFSTWVNENGEVILLPVVLTRDIGGVKLVEGSTENTELFSSDITGEMDEVPQSGVVSDGDSIYLYWFDGNDEKIHIRQYKPSADSIGSYLNEDFFVKKVIHYNGLIYNGEPHILWLDDYGVSGGSGVFPVKLSSIY